MTDAERLEALRHKQSILFTTQDTMAIIQYATELEQKLDTANQKIADLQIAQQPLYSRRLLEEKVERMQLVVDAAKEITHMPPVMAAGRHTLWELRKPDMQPLIDAVKRLEEIENGSR